MRDDFLIFTPDDVDLARSPLRGHFADPTYVLGAFNPGFTRLANGHLLLMVRVAEALRTPVVGGQVRAIRWDAGRYVLDAYPLDAVDMADPRQFELKGLANRVLGLTSLSWLLPVELSADGREVLAVHYDRAIVPDADYMQYGVEDARISRIGARWYMTACAVSAERHCTVLYTSDDALDWRCHGIVLDHQNKDMALFEGQPGGEFWAITRPLGEVYFAPPPGSGRIGGPGIQFARSPDALHWKPHEARGIFASVDAPASVRVGGGSPPVLTPEGWLMIWHGVEKQGKVGIYRSFTALLDADDPGRVLKVEHRTPVLEAAPALTAPIAHQMYLPSPVVFTTGLVDGGDRWIVASGEADLACRITHLSREALR